MKMRGYILRGGLFLAVAVVGTFVVVVSSSTPATAQSAKKAAVSFDSDGAMTRPEGYREWVYVGTPLTPNDMNNGSAPFPEFHNVYIQPDAFAAYKRTCKGYNYHNYLQVSCNPCQSAASKYRSPLRSHGLASGSERSPG